MFNTFAPAYAHTHAHTSVYIHKTDHTLAHKLIEEIDHVEISCVTETTCWHVWHTKHVALIQVKNLQEKIFTTIIRGHIQFKES